MDYPLSMLGQQYALPDNTSPPLSSLGTGYAMPPDTFMKNMQWGQSAPSPQGYNTQLAPQDEAQFQQWVRQNNVPFDPSTTADYDMRGFWKAQQAGNPNARTGVNANDGLMHFGDYFKTPYHQSFSSESQWALPNAPSWNSLDQLVTPGGQVVFDERARR
jgi:hypothetical protein